MSEVQNKENEQKPAENEIADYYDGVKKLEMKGHESGIKKARNALFITAALLLIGEVITMSQSGLEWTPLAIAIVAVEVGIFIALGFWTKTKPFTAIVVGLIVFIGLWIWALSVVGFDQIARGILVRIIIIGVLISALKPAKAWEDLKKNG